MPTFPNANYLFHKTNTSTGKRNTTQDWARDTFDSVLVVDAGKATMVTGDHEIDTGPAQHTPGHTPGGVCLRPSTGENTELAAT